MSGRDLDLSPVCQSRLGGRTVEYEGFRTLTSENACATSYALIISITLV